MPERLSALLCRVLVVAPACIVLSAMPTLYAADDDGVVTGSSGAPEIPLKQQQASVKGLITMMQPGGGDVGSAVVMSVAVREVDKSVVAQVAFTHHVGKVTLTGLTEVAKCMQLRHRGWPKGYQIELSCEKFYLAKDGPSWAVACALLLNSLITGKENDPEFAVAGDMNVDGSVQPVGGVVALLRGAASGQCKVAAVPTRNADALGDLLLTEGPALFAKVQIYSVSSFDEAESLALKERPAATQKAISDMAQVQEVLLKDPSQMGAWLRNQHVIAKLQAVLQATPHNVSARYLLMYATGRVPKTLSLAGSLDSVRTAAADLIEAIKANDAQQANMLKKDVVGSSITRLQSLRTRCDPRILPYADAIVRFGSAVKEAQDRPANSGTRFNTQVSAIRSTAGAANAEMERLMTDPKVVEELER